MPQEVWKELEGIYRDGLAKNIGVSNFTLEELKTLLDNAKVTPAVNQVSGSKLCSPVD